MSKEKSLDKEVVSIRCRRHKKRFNVPKYWLKTSKWLCPHCYAHLSKAERSKYAPKATDNPEVREAEEGKPTKFPSTQEVQPIVQKIKKPKARIKPFRESRNASNDELEVDYPVSQTVSYSNLLPKWRLKCQKCGKVRPVHKVWGETSRMLCPECFFGMTPDEQKDFHRSHFTEPDAFFEDNGIGIDDTHTLGSRSQSIYFQAGANTDLLSLAGRCSEHFIRTASIRELRDEVRRHRLSKTRMRIELQRRKNISYYKDLPDASIIPACI